MHWLRRGPPLLSLAFSTVDRKSSPTIFKYPVQEPDNDAFSWVEAPSQPTYRIKFLQHDLWELYDGAEEDAIEIEIW